MNELTEEQVLFDINEGKGSKLYRTIVPINIEKDAKKN